MYVGILIGKQWQPSCFDPSVKSWSCFSSVYATILHSKEWPIYSWL